MAQVRHLCHFARVDVGYPADGSGEASRVRGDGDHEDIKAYDGTLETREGCGGVELADAVEIYS